MARTDGISKRVSNDIDNRKSKKFKLDRPSDASSSKLNGRKKTFADLTPHCMETLIGFMNDFTVIRMALVNGRHFRSVQYAFLSKTCLNFFINSCKQCLSHDPCQQVSSYRCRHKVIQKMRAWMYFLQLKLIRPRTIYISSPMCPRSLRMSMHGFRKILSEVKSDVVRVYVNVSNEDHYVKPIKELLERNRETIQLIHIRSAEPETSKLKFEGFEDITKFGEEGWIVKPRKESGSFSKNASS